MSKFPPLREFSVSHFHSGVRRLLIASEGFEERSLTWLRSLGPDQKWFHHAFVCRYQPEKKARLNELLDEIRPRCLEEPRILEFGRFSPTLFEQSVDCALTPVIWDCDEVTVDISVMSKLMIMILIWHLREFKGVVRIVYTEPVSYTPSQEEYEKQKDDYGKPITLPSYGVHEVVRTPQLSSVVMQRGPALVVTFASFNEQLIRALLSTISPTRLLLINGRPPHLLWREKATQEIHSEIIREYADDNPRDPSTGLIRRSASTLHYGETFDILGQIYRENCYLYRMVVAPTGSKMQALGCALFKICCPDVHIEYPTPESYFISGYSSNEARSLYEVVFDSFVGALNAECEQHCLNG